MGDILGGALESVVGDINQIRTAGKKNKFMLEGDILGGALESVVGDINQIRTAGKKKKDFVQEGGFLQGNDDFKDMRKAFDKIYGMFENSENVDYKLIQKIRDFLDDMQKASNKLYSLFDKSENADDVIKRMKNDVKGMEEASGKLFKMFNKLNMVDNGRVDPIMNDIKDMQIAFEKLHLLINHSKKLDFAVIKRIQDDLGKLRTEFKKLFEPIKGDLNVMREEFEGLYGMYKDSKKMDLDVLKRIKDDLKKMLDHSEKIYTMFKNSKRVDYYMLKTIKYDIQTMRAKFKNLFGEAVTNGVADSNYASCDLLTGVAEMTCISTNTAIKIKEEGSLTARAFLKEADNLATNIHLIGDKAAKFMKQIKFGSIPIKKFQAVSNSTNNKLSAKISLKYITNFGNCNTLIGILKFKCLVHVAILQIKVIGNVADKKIKNVASNSRLTILNLAVEVNKISGFKDVSDNMVASANIFKAKCYSLSEKLSRSKVATVLDIQRAASCQN